MLRKILVRKESTCGQVLKTDDYFNFREKILPI